MLKFCIRGKSISIRETLKNKVTKVVIVALEIIFTTKLHKCNCKEMITDRRKNLMIDKKKQKMLMGGSNVCDHDKPHGKSKV